MDRWLGKRAVVTGASSGIGTAIGIDLANAGLSVIALARRRERLDEIKSKVTRTNGASKIYPITCDVSDEAEVRKTFIWIGENFGGIHKQCWHLTHRPIIR